MEISTFQARVVVNRVILITIQILDSFSSDNRPTNVIALNLPYTFVSFAAIDLHCLPFSADKYINKCLTKEITTGTSLPPRPAAHFVSLLSCGAHVLIGVEDTR